MRYLTLSFATRIEISFGTTTVCRVCARWVRAAIAFAVSLMDEESLRKIAEINLLANLSGETDLPTWEDYVAQMKGLTTAEKCLELIKPAMLLRGTDEG